LIRRSSTFIRACAMIVVSAIFCPQITALLAQATSKQASSNVDAKVAAIMDDVLKRGEGYAGDVKTYTWVPPLPADFERIREIGHDAIKPLSRCFDSPRRPFLRTLAVRFLGEIGGADGRKTLKVERNQITTRLRPLDTAAKGQRRSAARGRWISSTRT
jgi:hypothetical protein